MTRTRAGKKVDALDAKIAVLEHRRREAEIRALGAEAEDVERRRRYFAIPDIAERRRLITLERRLHELRREHRAASVIYWTTVTEDTRAKLADLRSDAPGSNWRRGLWWDIATVFWILVGLGWLTFQLPGAIVGAVASALWARFIVRNRAASRVAFLRQGDDTLRSNESQLLQAQREAAAAEHAPAPFSAPEQESGVPDATPAGVAGPTFVPTAEER